MSDYRDQRQGDHAVINAIQNAALILDSQKDPDGSKLISTAEDLSRYLVRVKMSTSQIRKLFNEVKNLNFKDGGPYKVNILRAKLAYTAGRHKKEVGDLQRVLDISLNSVGSDENKYHRFVNFFEAIVAYHRKHGGKE